MAAARRDPGAIADRIADDQQLRGRGNPNHTAMAASRPSWAEKVKAPIS